MRELLELICSELSAGRPLASAVITDSSGSTPRSTGTRMAVSADGQSRGTVGGGPGEAMAQREAKNVLRTQIDKLLKLDLTGKDVADSGMICGGRLAVLVEYIAPSPENIRLFEDLRADWEAGEGCMLCTVFREKDGGVQILSRTAAPERLPKDLPAELHDKVQRRAAKARLPFAESQNGCTILVEPIRSRGRLIIAGAGHVGQATAHMAALSGFHTVVMDDRPDFLVPAHYPPACRLRQIAGFADCFNGLSIGPDSLIVIVTRGHVHDQTVLAQALATDAGYVGMIGSRKKRDAIYQNLREQGISQAAIDRVHCPIGLDIGADTPEEIAVSIVAELIQKRAENG